MMAQKQGTSGNKRRKRGDWEAIARGRANVDRVLVNHSGNTGIPAIGEVGSAAYRRLLRKRSGR